MRLWSLIPLTLLLAGCFGRPDVTLPAPVTPPPDTLTPPPAAKPGKDGKVDPLEQAKLDRQKYEELAAQADARVKVLTKQYAEERLQAQVLWITGISLLLAAICGVAAFLVPLGKKTLVCAAIGFAAVAACAQAFQAVLPYLPWIGGVLLLGGGLWATFHWRRLGSAVQVAADHGDRLEEWLQDLPDDAREQALKIVADAKVEAQKTAQRLGIHTDLQRLRGKVPNLWQRITNKAG